MWAWSRESHGTITSQMRTLGSSVDWSRERFTLDDDLSRAVRRVFVTLYREGLIYRGKYIVNWCTRCRTALSDLEVVHEEQAGRLYHVRYPGAVEGRADAESDVARGAVTVATTRPETMLGDTAVAVHPDDDRYRGLVGGKLRLPIIGRELPVVADGFVDAGFGTGAVKVTPAHDPNDFEMGRRHDLAQVVVIGEDGRMTAEAGPFAGRDRFAAREAIVERLEAEGLLERIEDHRHAVGHCSRCHTVVEPLVSTQWFGAHRAPGRARHRRREGRPHPLRARELGPHVLRVDDQHPRLVHLAPALVGTSGAGLVLRSVRVGGGGGGGPGGLRVRRPPAPGHRRARHLVQLGALAVQHHGGGPTPPPTSPGTIPPAS